MPALSVKETPRFPAGDCSSGALKFIAGDHNSAIFDPSVLPKSDFTPLGLVYSYLKSL
jgi:hypothetical protein